MFLDEQDANEARLSPKNGLTQQSESIRQRRVMPLTFAVPKQGWYATANHRLQDILKAGRLNATYGVWMSPDKQKKSVQSTTSQTPCLGDLIIRGRAFFCERETWHVCLNARTITKLITVMNLETECFRCFFDKLRVGFCDTECLRSGLSVCVFTDEWAGTIASQ